VGNLIISVSGLRGVVGEELTPELAARFACAYAAGQAAGKIVLARDGRGSGQMLADAIRGSLQAVGRSVLDAGVAATPTVGVLLSHHGAAGAIQVSASHNPPEYNGIKLFAQSGQVLSAADGEAVVRRFHAGVTQWVAFDRLGRQEPLDDTLAHHAELVTRTVDVPRIRAAGFRVVLDANHGAGSLLGRKLLEELGCDVTLIGDQPDGEFAHPPEPTAENLRGICDIVAERAADVGFCQDPDADRLAVIDARGVYLGEEYTLAICLDQVLQERSGPVVTNCSTSRMAEDLAARYGVPFFRSPVGEANVVGVMKERNAIFGGEGNGGPIDPRVGFIRDSFVGMAWVLHAMARRRLPVSQLAAALPRYAICKTKATVAPSRVADALAAVERHFANAPADRMDGLRLDWPGKWVLIRASNTEPIVRIVAESATMAESQSLCDEVAAAIARA